MGCLGYPNVSLVAGDTYVCVVPQIALCLDGILPCSQVGNWIWVSNLDL